MRSDPRVEWKQMYYDAWRIQREFFYDRDLHGLDLQRPSRGTSRISSPCSRAAI